MPPLDDSVPCWPIDGPRVRPFGPCPGVTVGRCGARQLNRARPMRSIAQFRLGCNLGSSLQPKPVLKARTPPYSHEVRAAVIELWIPITVFAAFMQNLRSALQKHLKGRLSTGGASYVRFFYA